MRGKNLPHYVSRSPGNNETSTPPGFTSDTCGSGTTAQCSDYQPAPVSSRQGGSCNEDNRRSARLDAALPGALPSTCSELRCPACSARYASARCRTEAPHTVGDNLERHRHRQRTGRLQTTEQPGNQRNLRIAGLRTMAAGVSRVGSYLGISKWAPFPEILVCAALRIKWQ